MQRKNTSNCTIFRHWAILTFHYWVSYKTRKVFADFINRIFESKFTETCKIEITSDNSIPIHVLAEGIASETGESCLLTLIDIQTASWLVSLSMRLICIYENCKIYTNIISEISENHHF